jgi:hypothetical protein
MFATFSRRRKKPRSVYLAARFGRRDEMRLIADELRDVGFVVTSRWLDSPEQLSAADLAQPDRAARLARMDLFDVARADVCIAFTEPHGQTTTGRGGRHTELGIFHCLPEIEQFEDWDGAKQHLLGSKGGDDRLPALTVEWPDADLAVGA